MTRSPARTGADPGGSDLRHRRLTPTGRGSPPRLARRKVEQELNDRNHVDEIAARVFGWNALRAEQLEERTALLSGRDVLALLPTGSGKQVIPQAPGVLLDAPLIPVPPRIDL